MIREAAKSWFENQKELNMKQSEKENSKQKTQLEIEAPEMGDEGMRMK